jgi:hypothetical protein
VIKKLPTPLAITVSRSGPSPQPSLLANNTGYAPSSNDFYNAPPEPNYAPPQYQQSEASFAPTPFSDSGYDNRPARSLADDSSTIAPHELDRELVETNNRLGSMSVAPEKPSKKSKEKEKEKEAKSKENDDDAGDRSWFEVSDPKWKIVHCQ